MRKNNFRKNVSKLTFLLAAFIGATQIVTAKNVSALEDFALVRANTAVRAIATNLGNCFENAQDTVLFSEDGITEFDGSKFWKNPNEKVTLPEVLYGKDSRDKNEATCTELITGWKTNWFFNLFTGDGKFAGLIKENIVVPDNSKEKTYYLNEEEKNSAKQRLQTYLKGVGYKEQSGSSTAFNGYRCFYANLKIRPELFGKYFDGYGMAPPLNNSYDFSSQENFCLYVDNNNKVDYINHGIFHGDSWGENGETNYINRSNDTINHIQIYYWPYNGYAWYYDDYYNINISTTAILGTYAYDEDVYYFPEPTTLEVEMNEASEGSCEGRIYDDASACSLVSGSNEEITYDEAKSRFKTFLEGQVYCVDYYGDSGWVYDYCVPIFSSVDIVDIDMGSMAVSYEKGNKRDFVKYFLEDDNINMTKEEQYMFYYDHLRNYFGVDVHNNSGSGSDDRVEVYWLDDNNNTFSKKYLYSSDNKKKAQLLCDTTYSDPHWCAHGTEGTWRDFAEKLAELSSNPDTLTAAFENAGIIDTEYGDLVEGNTGTANPTGTVDQCYQSAGSLGWFICPVMNTAAKAMLRMYNSVEQDFLVVESDLTSTNSMTRNAWSIFVNFANIAMVILLLIVIISQITGFGIDNYGIKKLLPKIITVALLVNLSFIICQLAVDISNIVGKSAKDLLVNTANSLTTSQIPSCSVVDVDCHNSAGWFKALMLIAGGGILGLGGIEIAQGILTGGMLDGLIIPILILVLVAVIAVIFFFILLGLRKAAIVILMVISPLAFICYALPNTKKLFTKWFDAMKGLLLLYPLCGLIIGGGTLASKIILSASQDYVTYFIGAIMMVVPFFMVPSLLKSSFKALGGIGAKISGLGKSLRTKTQSRADKVHRNSTGYKARQADFANRAKFRQDRVAARRAKRTQGRLSGRSDLSEAQQNRLRYANDTALAMENQLQENEIRTDTNYVTAAQFQQKLAAEKQRQENEIRASKDYVFATRNQQKLATEKQRQENKLHATDDYYHAMQAKQGLDVEHENKVIGRYGDRTYVESQKAALEADSRSKDIDAELALLRNRDNINTLTGFESHLEALKSRTSFGDSERTELAALARGIVGFKGGAGALAKMVRDSSSSDAFRQALSSIYSQDISVSSKLNEKDAGASIYLEALGSGGATGDFASYASSDPASAYQAALAKRVKSNAAGLNQSGEAFKEYLNSLASETPPATGSEEFIKAKNRLQDVMNDATLLNSLDVKDREAVRTRAAIYGVTGAEAQAVRIIHEQQPAPQPAPQPVPQSQPTQDEQGEIHVNFSGDGGMDG